MTRRRKVSPQTQALLTVLVQDPTVWRHGYEISKLTGLKSGTLYPLLMRLHDQGFLASGWAPPEPDNKPPRHLYRLTVSGLAFARSQSASSAPSLLGVPVRTPA